MGVGVTGPMTSLAPLKLAAAASGTRANNVNPTSVFMTGSFPEAAFYVGNGLLR